MKRGDISAYFESGNTERNVQTISYNPNDPGGKSYGKYQLAARTGTLKKFIAWSRFNDKFKDTHLASTEFDRVWIDLATTEPDFGKEQQEFIEKTHFVPVQHYAKALGFDVTNFALNEVLFSIGVQHGGYKKILNQAITFRTSAIPNVEEDIANLYKARNQYVCNIGLTKTMEKALHNRYDKEYKIASSLCEELRAFCSNDKNDTELQSYINEVHLSQFV